MRSARGTGKVAQWLGPHSGRMLRHPDCEHTMPFGLAQMDNGEIAIVVSREKANPAGGRILRTEYRLQPG